MGKSAFTIREDVTNILRELVQESRHAGPHELTGLLLDRLEARGLAIVERRK